MTEPVGPPPNRARAPSDDGATDRQADPGWPWPAAPPPRRLASFEPGDTARRPGALPHTGLRDLSPHGLILAVNVTRDPPDYLVWFPGGTTRVLTGYDLERVPARLHANVPPHKLWESLVTARALAIGLERGGLTPGQDRIDHYDLGTQVLAAWAGESSQITRLRLQDTALKAVTANEANRHQKLFPVALPIDEEVVKGPRAAQDKLVDALATLASPGVATLERERVQARRFVLENAMVKWYGSDFTVGELRAALQEPVDARVAARIAEALATAREKEQAQADTDAAEASDTAQREGSNPANVVANTDYPPVPREALVSDAVRRRLPGPKGSNQQPVRRSL
jgi:hypothetical protein